MSEILTIFSVVIISSQSSSLVSSLLLVFFSMGIMFLVKMNIVYSGFLCYVFIMIFIGGLMVLLVSVASMVSQEQPVSFSFFLGMVLVSSLFTYSGFKKDWGLGSDYSENMMNLLGFLDCFKLSMTGGLLLVLVICLFVVTKLVLEYKGLTRNL